MCSSPLPWAPLDATWPISLGVAGLEAAVERLVGEAVNAVAGGAEILVIGDRSVGAERARRSRAAGGRRRPPRARARAACARAARWSSTPASRARSTTSRAWSATAPTPCTAGWRATRSCPRWASGLLKVMSKMGVSTVSAYRGAQVFEAIGLATELVDRHFTGTPSKLGGIGLRGLAREVLMRHARTYLPVGGLYRWRAAASATAGTRTPSPALQRGEWRRYVEAADAASRHGSLRGLLAFRERRADRPRGRRAGHARS